MSQHRATIAWRRETEDFTYESYNRSHEWRFANDIVIPASAAPEFLGTPDRVDPEEAFVATISACHMLTFLAICARKRLTVLEYVDEATGHLEKNAAGALAITRVELSPRIRFAGDPPADRLMERLHEQSHAECFIANSVLTDIRVVSPKAAS